jgi:hypothetical protein
MAVIGSPDGKTQKPRNGHTAEFVPPMTLVKPMASTP